MQQALATGETTIRSLREALEVEERRRDKLQFEVACASTAEADVERLMVLVASLEKNLAEVRNPTDAGYTSLLYFSSFFLPYQFFFTAFGQAVVTGLALSPPPERVFIFVAQEGSAFPLLVDFSIILSFRTRRPTGWVMTESSACFSPLRRLFGVITLGVFQPKGS